MIPAGIIGVCFADQIEALFSSLWFVGCMLLLTAALLSFAYYAKPRQKTEISYRDAFLIGCAQAVATMPGLSRSGSTIATGLLLGNDMLLDILSGEMSAMSVPTDVLIYGFVSAFISGALACKFMIEIVKRGRLIWFAVYCAVVGLICLFGAL